MKILSLKCRNEADFSHSKICGYTVYKIFSAYMYFLVYFVGNDIPPVPSGAYDYDQLGQLAKNENKNTDKPHYYDTLTNLEYIPYQNISES